VKLNHWKEELDLFCATKDDINSSSFDDDNRREGSVVPISELWNPSSVPTIFDENDRVTPTDIEKLNDDQRRAYDIVDWHLHETMKGKNSP
jgi:hypothetical protein